MISILFSASEKKLVEGKKLDLKFKFNVDRDSLINNYFKLIEESENLEKIFSSKNTDRIKKIKSDIIKNKKYNLKAIERYCGVSYDYLKYASLNKQEKNYIDKNTIIFSNLFGPVLASDLIPFYKLKQNEKIFSTSPAEFYKEKTSRLIDDFLKDKLIIDLRANYYKKFYKLEKYHITLKFLKDNKTVTHYSKAYRGEFLRLLATNNIKKEKDIKSLKSDYFKLIDIKESKLNSEYIYSII